MTRLRYSEQKTSLPKALDHFESYLAVLDTRRYELLNLSDHVVEQLVDVITAVFNYISHIAKSPLCMVS
jgi:hypothetical protein